mgnify:CR=1 FL=1
MKEFRKKIEQIMPNIKYQEEWQGEMCFNIDFISRIIIWMEPMGIEITEEEMNSYARMPIDIMVEKRPELCRRVLTVLQNNEIKEMLLKSRF